VGKKGEAARNCAPLPGGDFGEQMEWFFMQLGYPRDYAYKTIETGGLDWYGTVPMGGGHQDCVIVIFSSVPIPRGESQIGSWGHWEVPVTVAYYTKNNDMVIYNYAPAP